MFLRNMGNRLSEHTVSEVRSPQSIESRDHPVCIVRKLWVGIPRNPAFPSDREQMFRISEH
jgi:hypothetical protein